MSLKIKVTILCLPLYVFTLLGSYWESKTYLTNKFSFKKETKEYWHEVREILKEKD